MYYVFLAEGFEEIEALTQTDVLKRAGIDVINVGVTGEFVKGAHGIVVKSDISLSDAFEKNDAEGIILPGGMPGTTNLFESEKLNIMIKKAYDEKKLIAAICAAPSILGKLGLLKGKKATCYPGFEETLFGAKISKKNVVKDENIITSRGAGTAMEFALSIAEYITGKKMDALAEAMIYKKRGLIL